MERGNVLETVLDEYDDEPEGWKFLTGLDNNHNLVFYFFHCETIWILKKNAYSGYDDDFVGDKIEVKNNGSLKKIEKSLCDFGFRSGDADEIMKDFSIGRSPEYIAKKYSPQSREDCFGAQDTDKLGICGAISNTMFFELPYISRKQVRLDQELTREVNLMNKKKTEGMYG